MSTRHPHCVVAGTPATAGSMFRAAGFLCLLSVTVWSATAAGKPPVEIRLHSIALVKVKTVDPLPGAEETMTPGLTVTFGIRATDGRPIRRLGKVEIRKAEDDTGRALSAAGGGSGVFHTVHFGRGGATQRSRRSVIVKTITRGGTRAGPNVRLFQRGKTGGMPSDLVLSAAAREGATTATVTTHFDSPAARAKSLAILEGTITLELGEAQTFKFHDVQSQINSPLDIGVPKSMALEVTKAEGGAITLEATGDTSRIGDLTFFDRQGKKIAPKSSNRSSTMTDGIGTAEMEFDLGDVIGPIDLEVVMYGSTEEIEAPFVFKNIELP